MRVGVAHRASWGRVVGSVGSGGLVDSRGLVLTCQHVVDRALALQVSGRELAAQRAGVVVQSLRRDLAVVRFPIADANNQPLLSGGAPAPKSHLLACGFPGGGPAKATPVSLQTAPPVRSGLLEPAELLRLEGDIRLGDSGGPLLDADLRVVGIVQARYGDEDSVGFAAPVSRSLTLIRSAQALLCLRDPFWLGAGYGDVQGELRLIFVEEESALAAAGVQEGAVITGLNGRAMASAGRLRAALLAESRESATLHIRDGLSDVPVHISLRRPPIVPSPTPETIPGDSPLGGARLQTINPVSAMAAGAVRPIPGVLILDPGDTIADQVGFEPGDIVTEVDGHRVGTVASLAKMLAASRSWRLTVQRGAETINAAFDGGALEGREPG